jgi:hypothetical protein
MKRGMRGDREPFIVMMTCISQFGSCGNPGYDQRYFKSEGLSSKCHFSMYSLLFFRCMKFNCAVLNKSAELTCKVTVSFPFVFVYVKPFQGNITTC